MRRAVVVLAAIVSGAALAGCGASTKITRVGGVIEIGGGVKSSALAKSVLGVRVGTRATVMRARLGAPSAKTPVGGLNCWVYHAHQPGYAQRELDFCVNRNGRVGAISLGAIHF